MILDDIQEKGIPDFWMNLLENRTFLPEQIQVWCYLSLALAFAWQFKKKPFSRIVTFAEGVNKVTFHLICSSVPLSDCPQNYC